jgi:hypothetical protein
VATVGRVGVKPRLDIGQGGGEAGQIGFLRQIADRGAGLGEAMPRIRLHQPGRNAHEGRLTGAVRPTRQTRSPAATASAALENRGVTPKVRLMSCSRSDGGGMAKEIPRGGCC